MFDHISDEYYPPHIWTLEEVKKIRNKIYKIMEKLKLSCKGYYFTRKGNTIYCHIKVYNNIIGYKSSVTGQATCGDGDNFNEITGRRLARSRAERDAFAQFHGWLIWKRIPKALEMVDALQDCVERMQQYTEHQKEYIKMF